MSLLSLLASSLACLLNDFIVPIFAFLVFLALLSQTGSILQSMVLHGKLRDLVPERQAASTPPLRPQPQAKRINNTNIWQWIAQGDYWMVSKQRFLHFYVVGTVCLVGTASSSADPWSSSQSLAQGLLLLHLLRRCYECLYVHQWRSTSVMHFSAYLLGLLYYALLPFIFCQLECPARRRQPVQVLTMSLGDDVSRVIGIPMKIASFLLCLYAQHQQARHHAILANVRGNHDEKTNPRKSTNTISSTYYQLPQGGWFRWVACPHYLAEILFYIGLAGLLPDLARGTIIVAWVVTSLTLNALQAQKWYQYKIPGYAKLNRKAIIPFWL